jgi:hypothetical protein
MELTLEKWKEELTVALNRSGETTKEFGLFSGYFDDEVLIRLAEGITPGEFNNDIASVFFTGVQWELVHSHTDDQDYSWGFYSVYKLTKQIKWGPEPKFLTVHVMFSGRGSSYNDDVYEGWKFVEPKFKTVEVWG